MLLDEYCQIFLRMLLKNLATSPITFYVTLFEANCIINCAPVSNSLPINLNHTVACLNGSINILSLAQPPISHPSEHNRCNTSCHMIMVEVFYLRKNRMEYFLQEVRFFVVEWRMCCLTDRSENTCSAIKAVFLQKQFERKINVSQCLAGYFPPHYIWWRMPLRCVCW